jgi:hypothetical protein
LEDASQDEQGLLQEDTLPEDGLYAAVKLPSV